MICFALDYCSYLVVVDVFLFDCWMVVCIVVVGLLVVGFWLCAFVGAWWLILDCVLVALVLGHRFVGCVGSCGGLPVNLVCWWLCNVVMVVICVCDLVAGFVSQGLVVAVVFVGVWVL